MPTVVDEQTTAYAHCGLPICPGHQQAAVPALRREVSYTYRDAGGDLPGEERSSVGWVFADEADAPCPHCGRLRELSGEPRRQYANLSGFDPDYIAKVSAGVAPAFDPSAPKPTAADEEVAALKAQMAQQQQAIDALLAEREES